jgi:hypothetical protein
LFRECILLQRTTARFEVVRKGLMLLDDTSLLPKVKLHLVPKAYDGFVSLYRRTSISGTRKAHITFPLRHFFSLKVVK